MNDILLIDGLVLIMLLLCGCCCCYRFSVVSIRGSLPVYVGAPEFISQQTATSTGVYMSENNWLHTDSSSLHTNNCTRYRSCPPPPTHTGLSAMAGVGVLIINGTARPSQCDHSLPPDGAQCVIYGEPNHKIMTEHEENYTGVNRVSRL